MTQDNGERGLVLACNYDPNEMQKCKCLCVRSSLLLWGAAAASVVDDTCHAAAAGRQNGDMLWEWGVSREENWATQK